MPNTKERTQAKDANRRFSGGGSNIVMMPSPCNLNTAVHDLRNGDIELSNIPWVGRFNHRLSSQYQSFREDRFNREDPADMRRYRDLLIESFNSDQSAVEMAGYREFELTNDVMATPWALSAFQSINLSADELPLIVRPRSRNLKRFTVRSVGIDGNTFRDQWRTTRTAEQIEMEMISTDRVEYPLMDLQQGDISQADAINRELQYDMEMHIDGLAKSNIDAAQVASGLRDSLNIHPKVVTANIPDKNYLDLDTDFPGNTGVLTIEKLKAILNHVALFGSAGGADEPISISTIMLSPQNMRDPWDFVDLVSGFSGGDAIEPKQTVPTNVRENIFSTGMMTNAWGHTFSWTPNAQLAKGRMYVMTSQPLGWYFTKSEFDRVHEWNETNSPDHAENNVGEILWKKAAKFVVPDQWRHRVVIIDL